MMTTLNAAKAGGEAEATTLTGRGSIAPNLDDENNNNINNNNINKINNNNSSNNVNNGNTATTTIKPTDLPSTQLPSTQNDSIDPSSSSSSLSSPGDDAPPPSSPPSTSAPSSPPAQPQRTRLETFIILASLCSSVFLAALDVTIVTTALPTISEHFHSDAGYTWVGSAYLLANAASVPSWGKVSDIWGRKPVLLCAAAVFFVGSLLSATAVSIEMLIASRAVQGVGGGGLIILVNICISDLFSMRERGTYFGMIGMVWALASAIGPVLGGVFTEKITWRWCFFINLPISGTAFFVLLFFLKLDTPKTPVLDGLKAVDWVGSLTVVGGTLMVLLGLQFGGITEPWGSATVVCLIVFGIVVGALFLLNEWKLARYPVMPLRIFSRRSSIASLLVCFSHGFVFVSGSFFLPLYFQAVLGVGALRSGIYLLPYALSLSVTSAATGVFIRRTGLYLPAIRAGMVLMTLGFGLFIDLGATPNWPKIVVYQIVAGVGVGPNFQSPLLALQTMLRPRDIAAGTATFGFTRQLATSISVVIGSVVFQNEMQRRYATLLAALGPAVADQLRGGSAGASVGVVQSLPPAQQEVAQQAFAQSLRIMWTMYTAFAAAGVLVSWFVTHQKLDEDHHVTQTGLAAEEENRRENQRETKREKARQMGRKSSDEEEGEEAEEKEEKVGDKATAVRVADKEKDEV